MEPVRRISKELYAVDGPDGIWWLGNAGFAIRLQKQYIFIDPCVTEYHERSNPHAVSEWTRLHEFPLEANEFMRADHVLYSHEHSDHMDLGLLPKLVELRSDIWAPKNCEQKLINEGAQKEKVHIARAGNSFKGDGYTVEFTRTRHVSCGKWYYQDVKDQDECGCGFLMKTQYGNIFQPGDTCYLEELSKLDVDYLLLPINDTNMGVGWTGSRPERK